MIRNPRAGRRFRDDFSGETLLAYKSRPVRHHHCRLNGFLPLTIPSDANRN